MFSFPLFQIPVTVRPSFLLVATLLGVVGTYDPVLIVAWVVIVFVSILVHELGHALTARGFGAEVEVELNGIGGLTRWSIPSAALGPGRRALIAASGSAVGVVFGGIIWLIASQFGPYRGLAFFVINNLIVVNVVWGLLNWLPIRPLDGGHLLLSLLEKFAPNRGPMIARVVFVTTAGLGVLLGIRYNRIFIAAIAGWLLLAEFSSGQREVPAGPIPEFSYDDEVEQSEANDDEQPEPAEWPVEDEPEERDGGDRGHRHR